MKLLVNSKYQCTILSAAMLLNKEPEDIVNRLGHDGQTIIFPDLREPTNRLGIHTQEIIDLFLSFGYGLIPIEAAPIGTTDNKNEFIIYSEDRAKRRFYNALKFWDGLICGETDKGIGHTVVWDHTVRNFYDPRKSIYGIYHGVPDFNIKTFWAMISNHEQIII